MSLRGRDWGGEGLRPTLLTREKSFLRRGSMGQASEVHIAGLLGLACAYLECAGIGITPDFRMPVGEIESIAVVVAVNGYGGEIKPNAGPGGGGGENGIYVSGVLPQ